MFGNKLKTITRRNFVLALIGMSLACKESLKDGQKETISDEILLGEVGLIANSYNPFPQLRIAVLLEKQDNLKIYRALSLVCTHQSCIVTRKPDNGFSCPCHGATFDQNGTVLQGPAKKDLLWKKLLAKDGKLYLLPSETVSKEFSLILHS